MRRLDLVNAVQIKNLLDMSDLITWYFGSDRLKCMPRYQKMGFSDSLVPYCADQLGKPPFGKVPTVPTTSGWTRIFKMLGIK